MDDAIASFISITNAEPQKAQSYLRVSDGDLEQALQLFFETGGADMDAGPSVPAASGPPPSLPPRPAQEPIIEIDDDIDDIEDDDVREVMRASERAAAPPAAAAATASSPGGDYEDDEAMARRLQEEFYTQGGGGGGAGGDVDPDGVRAPIARTMETLVGPEEDDDIDFDRLRQYARAGRGLWLDFSLRCIC
jgi:hypothetical protein